MPTIHNSRSADVIVEGVHLRPGANDVTEAQAKQLRESLAYKRHARRGWLGGLDLAAAPGAKAESTSTAPAPANVQPPPAHEPEIHDSERRSGRPSYKR